MTDPQDIPPFAPRANPAILLVSVTAVLVGVLACGGWLLMRIRFADLPVDGQQSIDTSGTSGDRPFEFDASDSDSLPPPRINKHGALTLHWEPLSPAMTSELAPTLPTSAPDSAPTNISNIHPQDYIGPEACKKCHAKNYEHWSEHPHRFMNARAEPETVKGDFSGGASIQYQGAIGTFYIDDEQYRMKIQRGELTHVYHVKKTLGSRFFQYFIGAGVEGPAPKGHEAYYNEEHVLPFGYWIDRKMWVPIVHVADELPDEGGRWNPLDPPFHLKSGTTDMIYAERCSVCHTTYPMGDSIIRHPDFRSKNLPFELHLGVADYTAKSHPELWDGSRNPHSISDKDMYALVGRYSEFQTPDQAATLGISCEACHLGARAHAEGRLKKPAFVAQSEALMTNAESSPATGPVHDNVNWACSRCHVGHRPQYASGVSTWNSVEFSDAMRGACYSQLTCIDCHEPHTAIGKRWSRPPAVDDAVCMKCHDKFKSPATRKRHTHHSAGSDGDRCLNCHMPRINEGLQDAVRTHMIYSPTRADMIEAGHPNACNLCHLDQSIDWTLASLSKWYGALYDQAKLREAYPDSTQPLGKYWLTHSHEGTRLVTVDALAKQGAKWALSDMLNILDDEFLLNRQFAQKGIEDMLDVALADWGYVFFMTKAERRGPLSKIRSALAPSQTTDDTP